MMCSLIKLCRVSLNIKCEGNFIELAHKKTKNEVLNDLDSQKLIVSPYNSPYICLLKIYESLVVFFIVA
jgi:hypothetical protein